MAVRLCKLNQTVVDCLLAAFLITSAVVHAQIAEPIPDDGFRRDDSVASERRVLQKLPKQLSSMLQGCTPMNANGAVQLHLKSKSVFLQTDVACRNCVLEMLCVPHGERAHETILNVRARAAEVHTALLALGLKPGKAVVFFPDFKKPQGTKLLLNVHWVDEQGKLQSRDARQWIRHSINRYFSWPLGQGPPGVKLPHDELRHDPVNKQLIWYGPMSVGQRKHLLTLWDDAKYQAGIEEFFRISQPRQMTADFVFVGSHWDTVPGTQRRRYAAEDGHFITVANFTAATIDVAESSSASDGGELYEGWEERIPQNGTPVLLEIKTAPKQPDKPVSEDSVPADNPLQETE